MGKRRAKGTGTIKYNPKTKRYTLRKTVGRKNNGQRKVFTVTADTQNMCNRLMREKETKWEHDKDNPNAELDVYMLCMCHLQHQVEQKELKPKSIDRRVNTLNVIKGLKIANKKATEVSPKDVCQAIDELIEEERLKESSIKKVLDVINAAYKYKISLNDISYNPVSSVKKGILKRLANLKARDIYDADVEILSKSQQDLLIKECTSIKDISDSRRNNKGADRYKHGMSGWYILFLLYTGLRVGELISLKWEDYDENNSLIRVNKSTSIIKGNIYGEGAYRHYTDSTKNSKAREIRLNKDAINTLSMIKKISKYTSLNDYICVTKTGSQNTATNLEARARRIYSSIGLDFGGRLHILRKTFASNMYDKGARTKNIAAYIGDEDATVMKYYIAARTSIEVNGEMKRIVEVPFGVGGEDDE